MALEILFKKKLTNKLNSNKTSKHTLDKKL
jgi:hypothetical protein